MPSFLLQDLISERLGGGVRLIELEIISMAIGVVFVFLFCFLGIWLKCRAVIVDFVIQADQTVVSFGMVFVYISIVSVRMFI